MADPYDDILQQVLAERAAKTTGIPDVAYGDTAPATIGEPWTDPLSSSGPGSAPHQQYQFETPGALNEFQQRRSQAYQLPVQPMPPQIEFDRSPARRLQVERESIAAGTGPRPNVRGLGGRPAPSPVQTDPYDDILRQVLQERAQKSDIDAEVQQFTEGMSTEALDQPSQIPPELRARLPAYMESATRFGPKATQAYEGLRQAREQTTQELGESPIARDQRAALKGLRKTLKPMRAGEEGSRVSRKIGQIAATGTPGTAEDARLAELRGASGDPFPWAIPAAQAGMYALDFPGRMARTAIERGREGGSQTLGEAYEKTGDISGYSNELVDYAKRTPGFQLGDIYGAIPEGGWRDFAVGLTQDPTTYMGAGALKNLGKAGGRLSKAVPASQANRMTKALPQFLERASKLGPVAKEAEIARVLQKANVPEAATRKAFGKHLNLVGEPEHRLGFLGLPLPEKLGGRLPQKALESVGLDLPVKRATESVLEAATPYAQKLFPKVQDYAPRAQRMLSRQAHVTAQAARAAKREELTHSITEQLNQDRLQLGSADMAVIPPTGTGKSVKFLERGQKDHSQWATDVADAIDGSARAEGYAAGTRFLHEAAPNIPSPQRTKLAKQMKELMTHSHMPEVEGLQGLAKAGLHEAMSLWKNNMLMNPAWFGTNVLWDSGLQWAAGHRNPLSMKWATSALRKGPADEVIAAGMTRGQIQKSLKELDLADVSGGAFADLKAHTNARVQMKDELLGALDPTTKLKTKAKSALRTVAREVGAGGVSTITRKASEMWEQFSNTAFFLDLLEQGYDPASAAARIRTVKPNYSTTNKLVKTVRNFAPFVTWMENTLRNAPRILGEAPYLATAPRHAQQARAADEGEIQHEPRKYQRDTVPLGTAERTSYLNRVQGAQDLLQRRRSVQEFFGVPPRPKAERVHPNLGVRTKAKGTIFPDVFDPSNLGGHPVVSLVKEGLGLPDHAPQREPFTGGLSKAANPGETTVGHLAGNVVGPVARNLYPLIYEMITGIPDIIGPDYEDQSFPEMRRAEALLRLLPRIDTSKTTKPGNEFLDLYNDPDYKRLKKWPQELSRAKKHKKTK